MPSFSFAMDGFKNGRKIGIQVRQLVQAWTSFLPELQY